MKLVDHSFACWELSVGTQFQASILTHAWMSDNFPLSAINVESSSYLFRRRHGRWRPLDPRQSSMRSDHFTSQDFHVGRNHSSRHSCEQRRPCFFIRLGLLAKRTLQLTLFYEFPDIQPSTTGVQSQVMSIGSTSTSCMCCMIQLG